MNFDELLRHSPGEIRKISSSANDLVKALRALRLKKHRQESGLFIAEGARTLIEALELEFSPLCIAYLSTVQYEEPVTRIRQAVAKTGALSLEVTEGVLDKISSRDNPQTIIGLFHQQWHGLADLEPKTLRILALEEVRDPGNLGTIVRTCDGFGIRNVLLIGETADPFGLEAVRASMGSIFSVKLSHCSRDEFLYWLDAYKGEVVGTALEGAKDIAKTNWKTPHLILMGNEQRGLSSELKNACTQLIKIPMHGRADSFNLAVATGIALYCACSNE